MKTFFSLCISILFSLATAHAAPLAEHELPDPLKTWVPWVMQEVPDAHCPFLFNEREKKVCLMPATLSLKLGKQGGSFRQDWQVFRSGLVPLPGDAKNWPQQVMLDGKPLVVIGQDDKPMAKIELSKRTSGTHQITGQFNWSKMPESLALPSSVAMLELEVDGKAIHLPVRDEQNQLWLSRAENKDAANESILHVYRKIGGGIPLSAESRFELEVAGRAREIKIAGALLPQFLPDELQASLPTKLQADGSLLIQAKPGKWIITLRAHHPSKISQLSLPSFDKQQPDFLQADEEIWVFAAQPQLRNLSIEGASSIDSSQTNLNAEWRTFPAYLMRADSKFILKSLPELDKASQKLSLKRDLWLNFDGAAYTLLDRIEGETRQTARLEMGKDVQLGRLVHNDQDRVITVGQSQRAGLELGVGPLSLYSVSSMPRQGHQFAVNGWLQDMEKVEMNLFLPPGWRLLHAFGPDSVSGSWLMQWDLLDFFLLLITCHSCAKLYGRKWGVVAFLGLGLAFPDLGVLRYACLLICAGAALQNVLPENIWKKLLNGGQKILSLAVLLGFLVFFRAEVLQILYPGVGADLAYQHENNERQIRHKALRDNAGNHMPKPSAVEPDNENVLAEAAPANQPMAPPPPAADAAVTKLKVQPAIIEEEIKAIRKSSVQRGNQSYEAKTGLGKFQADIALDPDAQIQTGPGLPRWAFAQVRLAWQGVVQQNQTVSLLLMPPWLVSILKLLQIGLIAGLLYKLLLPAVPTRLRISKAGGALAASVFFCSFMLFHANPVHAQSGIPDENLLKQLQEKLTQNVECLPACGEISQMRLQLEGDQLQLDLELDAYIDTIVPLPGGSKHWLPKYAQLNGKPAFVEMDTQGALTLFVPKGHHRLWLRGPLLQTDSLQLPLPKKPRQVSVQANGWQVQGLDEETGVADTLQLLRHNASGSKQEKPQFPALLQVSRVFNLDLQWNLVTTVSRMGPKGVPAVLEIPLLPGESVTSSGITVKNGKVLLNLGAQTESVVWTSNLTQVKTMQLRAPGHSDWLENWQFHYTRSGKWHVSANGLRPISIANAADLSFFPWPGELLQLQFDRPKPQVGKSLTIDRAQMRVTPGERSSRYTLLLEVRTSRGLDHSISLPTGAELQSVKINGNLMPLQAHGQQLLLPFMPGGHKVEIEWRHAQELALSYVTKSVNLQADVANFELTVGLPDERWVLFTSGPGFGPAILFWGKLLILLVAAWYLRYQTELPLHARDWFLLALGLTQINWLASVTVVGWFFIIRRRFVVVGWRKHLISLGLLLWSILFLLALLAVVHSGLLQQPELHILGSGSNSSQLQWYVDRFQGAMPSAWMFSLPLLAYRALMLLWAIWLAWAILKWLQWGWQKLRTDGGILQSVDVKPASGESVAASTPAEKRRGSK